MKTLSRPVRIIAQKEPLFCKGKGQKKDGAGVAGDTEERADIA